jgi:hypothetical protein
MRLRADWLVAIGLLAPFAIATARGVSLPGRRATPERPFVRVTAVERGQGVAGPRLFVQLKSGRLHALAVEVRLQGASLPGPPPRVDLPPEGEARVALDPLPGAGSGRLEIRVREVLAHFDERAFDLERAAPVIVCEAARPRGAACAFPAAR